jgi:hypothetical protein
MWALIIMCISIFPNTGWMLEIPVQGIQFATGFILVLHVYNQLLQTTRTLVPFCVPGTLNQVLP